MDLQHQKVGEAVRAQLHEVSLANTAPASQYVLQQPAIGLALFGPSASGKSAFIAGLMRDYPDRFSILPIVTTRPPRSAIEPDRIFVTEEQFREQLASGELCYASKHYGHWHGARKEDFERRVASGKCLIMDPNQFPRLEMLQTIFSKGRLEVITFLPATIAELEKMSDDEVVNIYEGRMNNRGGTPSAEKIERLAEALETIRRCCKNSGANVFVNSSEQPPSKHYPTFKNLVDARLSDLTPVLSQAPNKSTSKLHTATDFPLAIREVLHYLESASFRYAIFAGFASHLLTGVPTSLDIDILVEAPESLSTARDSFVANGWALIKEEVGASGKLNTVVKKDGCEFDLVYSPNAARQLMDAVIEKECCESKVRVLSPEALLLLKINQLTNPNRPAEKIERDREVIQKLRAQIDSKIIAYLAGQMGSDYWLKGLY